MNFQWMSDGGIGTLFGNGFHTELGVAGGKARKLVTDDSLDVSQFTVSQTGTVAYVAESSAVLPELFVEGRVVSHFNDGFRDVAVQRARFTPIRASTACRSKRRCSAAPDRRPGSGSR
jgi:hypothetical protein